jgi:hypothetical protein
MEQVKYEGLKASIGGREFVLPPFTLKQNRTIVLPALQAIRDSRGDPVKAVEQYAKVVYAALSRNYPDLSYDEFEELQNDFSALAPLANKLLMQSGFAMGEAASPGGAADADPSTGSSSTGTSLPVSDGPENT